MRIALSRLAARTGRAEVVLPAYCCFSIPASAVAAGLRVRLVEVDARGGVDPEALARLPLERAAALVVTNLFGVPEPMTRVRDIARAAGCGVVDDAAQALGAIDGGEHVGSRGDVGILSFGRGKPLSALGGGAAIWPRGVDPTELADHTDHAERAHPLSATVRAVGYDLARHPVVLRLLASIPSLGIGTTVYDPGFARGPMSGTASALANAVLADLDGHNRERADRAQRIGKRITNETGFAPLLAREGAHAVHPRLGVRAPSASARDAALAALTALGATRMYPTPIGAIPELAAHLVGRSAGLGETFAGRLLSVPTHAGLGPARQDRLVRTLARIARATHASHTGRDAS